MNIISILFPFFFFTTQVFNSRQFKFRCSCSRNCVNNYASSKQTHCTKHLEENEFHLQGNRNICRPASLGKQRNNWRKYCRNELFSWELYRPELSCIRELMYTSMKSKLSKHILLVKIQFLPTHFQSIALPYIFF